MDNQEETFQYTYSAKEQAEVENIRKKYLPQGEDKMAQLRKLDSIPNRKAQAWSLVLGILGALILGTGMSLIMTELGAFLGSETLAIVAGSAIGAVGLVLVALAYPVYNKVLKAERQRIAPEVLRLTDELLK